MHRRDALKALVTLPLSGCWVGRAMGRNAGHAFDTPAPTPKPIPEVPGAKLAVTWVGHATMLIQLGPYFILTDPMFMPTVGQLAKRLREPGLDPNQMPYLDAVVISHMHQDHYSPNSLALFERKIGRLLLPENGLLYAPDGPYPARDMSTWQQDQNGELTITQVPVQHSGWRYAIDAGWMKRGYCGWVFEWKGITVYFSGDTGYNQAHFAATRRRFPHIDVAFIAIAPVEPREMQAAQHVGPLEALDAFADLGADVMIPMHYDTFWFGDDQPGDALRVLREGMRQKGVADDRVRIAEVGVPTKLL